jgi:hypothetical protein
MTMISVAASIVSLLYSPHSRLASFDRDGLQMPEIAAACACSEDDVYMAMPQLVRTGMVVQDPRTHAYYRPQAMVDRQRQA